jgi:voltage-gated potassium channel Kch
LATGGEFAFVLFALAARERVLDTGVADLLVLSVTLSMIVGPLLVMAWEPLLKRWLAPEPARAFDQIEPEENRVIIAGFGRFGQIVARVLAMRGIPFTALDANQTQVDFVRGFGSKVYYGDASRLDLLRAAGAERAELLVLAIDDVEASVRTAQLVHQQFPHLKVFARARNRQHAFQLMETEPRYVIRETLPASLETAREILEALGLSRARAVMTIDRFREHDAETLLRQYAVKDDTEKLKASAREAAAQLEQLFRADTASERDPPV